MRKVIIATAAAICLAACQASTGPDEVDAEALDAVALAVEDQMNEPALAIQDLLRTSAREAQVGWDTLFINLDGEPEPVNWWLQKRGFLELSGAQFATRAAFTLTKPVGDMLSGPDQPWFETSVTGEPAVDCETAEAKAANGCAIEMEVTPALTPAGKTAIGTPITPLRPISVTAIVTLGEDGEWAVLGLSGESQTPREIAFAAILGDPDARKASARAADDQMKGKLSQLAGEREPEINLEAYTPPNYVEPPPPVAPVAPQRQGSLPDSPFRPGN